MTRSCRKPLSPHATSPTLLLSSLLLSSLLLLLLPSLPLAYDATISYPPPHRQPKGFVRLKMRRTSLPPHALEKYAPRSAEGITLANAETKDNNRVSRLDRATIANITGQLAKLGPSATRSTKAIGGGNQESSVTANVVSSSGGKLVDEPTSTAKMYYWGGPVLHKIVNVYVVYSGNWTKRQVRLIETFISSISSSPSSARYNTVQGWWRQISTHYYQDRNGIKRLVTPRVRLVRTAYDYYTSSTIFEAIQKRLDSGRFQLDPNGVYMVLTSADIEVNENGEQYCGVYCGVRRRFSATRDNQTTQHQYVHIGDPIRQCPCSACVLGQAYKTTPNGMFGIDSMITTIGHELVEAATEPDLNFGWHDKQGLEAADKCHVSLGPDVWVTSEGRSQNYIFNLVGQNRTRFLVQALWRFVEPTGCYTNRRQVKVE